MSDWVRYLPFSVKPKVDESGVSNNWARRLGELLLATAELLEGLSPADWQRPGVRGSADAIVARLVPRSERRQASELTDAGVAARIRSLAVERLAGRPTTRIATLGAVLADAWELALRTERNLPVDATVSGAVALARSLAAPLPIRAVVRDRTLLATDAGWELGRGPELRGTAIAIVLFLYGRGDVPRPSAGTVGRGGEPA